LNKISTSVRDLITQQTSRSRAVAYADQFTTSVSGIVDCADPDVAVIVRVEVPGGVPLLPPPGVVVVPLLPAAPEQPAKATASRIKRANAGFRRRPERAAANQIGKPIPKSGIHKNR
jgi:hypothetical protein